MSKTRAIILAILICLSASMRPLEANELALGNNAKEDGTVMIPVVGPSRLNGITIEELYKMRSDSVYKYKKLLADTYEPSDSIFGMCESKKPWWGVWGMYIYQTGNQSTEGPAKESIYILNPYRLVSAEANSVGLWNKNAVTPTDMRNPAFPFLWESGPVLFYPKLKTARVWYLITKYNDSLKQWNAKMRVRRTAITGFSLIAYNARDFGFHYIYLDPQKSIGIQRWPAKAVQITQFLHCGGSCGYPGGCNNMSPHVPELDLNNMSQLPARAHLKLWRDEPESVGNPADFTFIIDFK